MANIPGKPEIPKRGSLQERAAQLRAQSESKKPPVASQFPATAQPAKTGAADDKEEFDSLGPVGQGDYVVVEGDSIASIAKTHGHFWETIWEEPANAYLKEVRKNPNVLLPEDRVTIPKLRPKQESGATEMRHRFKRKGEPSQLNMRVLNVDQPMANKNYTIVIDGKTKISGVTDADGNIEETPIPSNAHLAVLTVDPDGEVPLVFELQVGRMSPKDEISGIQKRLSNMGYGNLTSGRLDDRTRGAIKQFQEDHGLPVTGEPDAATQNKLAEVHGS